MRLCSCREGIGLAGGVWIETEGARTRLPAYEPLTAVPSAWKTDARLIGVVSLGFVDRRVGDAPHRVVLRP